MQSPRHCIRLLLLSLCCVLCGSPLRAVPTVETFRAGDRWAAVGDSITQNGTYYAWVYLYYATRFTSLTLDVYNCGISGDSAGGALRRYDWDIKPKHATVATVMLGMNDVSRVLYDDTPPSPDTLKRRQSALADYRANMTNLAVKLKADGARLVFITPTPFDETADLAPPKQTGVNGALGECARFMRELAASTGGSLIELHEPMTALNQRLQKNDPKATIVGPDRIHPAAPGHFVMAYHILKAQGMSSLVSTVDIDGASGQLNKADNATVTGLVRTNGAVEFTSLEGALPYPIADECRPALEWVPFEQELNQERLRIGGLAPGFHTLVIDGQRVGEFSAAEFSAGLNLATLRDTPQVRQSIAVLDLIRQWQKAIAHWDRGVAQVEHFVLKDSPRPISLEAVRSQLLTQIEKLKGSDAHMDKYNRSITERYLQVKPREFESKQEIAELVVRIRKAAQPVPHSYRIIPQVPREPSP